jgi:hypothetical protein
MDPIIMNGAELDSNPMIDIKLIAAIVTLN